MRVFDKMIDGPGGGGDDDDGEEEGATPGQPVPSGRSSRASSSAPPPSVPPSPPESPPDHPGEIRGDMGRYGPDHPGAMAPPPQPGALAPPPPPASPPASPPDEPASPPVLYGSMRIVLVNGRDLKSADRNGLSDPYAYLRLAGKKRKSKTIMKTLDPDWNEEFEFSGGACRDVTRALGLRSARALSSPLPLLLLCAAHCSRYRRCPSLLSCASPCTAAAHTPYPRPLSCTIQPLRT